MHALPSRFLPNRFLPNHTFRCDMFSNGLVTWNSTDGCPFQWGEKQNFTGILFYVA